MSTESVMLSHHHILCCAILFCFQSFPASRSFSMTHSSYHQVVKILDLQLQHQSFHNIQGWFPLGLTGLLSLQSKSLSRGFSNTTIQKHPFFSAQLSIWSNSHVQEKPWHAAVHGVTKIRTQLSDWTELNRKNHSFDYTNLWWQSDVSAF